MAELARIWIQGAGEMASGAAVALLEAGYEIVMAEIGKPLAVRRMVCFSEAVYEGEASVCGWTGVLATPAAAEFRSGHAVVLVDPASSQMNRLRPDLIVDARMTKRTPAPLPTQGRPVVGLGPGFVCGQTATRIVETMRGTDLGRVIDNGAAQPYSRKPGAVGGRTVSRLLRAPTAGFLIPLFKIGDMVAEGQVVGHVSGVPVVAGVAGKLRGLIHPQAELICGEKVGDVDPRGEVVDPTLMTDKAVRVGAGVLQAVREILAVRADDAN